ncbi:hypothetical protein GCM10007981_13330 [Thermocladium modestius]|uniref:Uncharacterized protein n=1 Tax=Thermocladium modestius TaxID=62609 RepID=A0A830GZC8_9CREN|nr:hypothetical protein [Thermocladium modestius]GGP21452.1 hypothetical protein GCM10007981_13330 [Thermocladium modestius]
MSSSTTNESNQSQEGEKKQVTIKGVDKELYERAVQLSREMGMTAGELVNKALRAVISLTDAATKTVAGAAQAVGETGKAFTEGARGVKVITGVDELTVTKADLQAVDSPISFRGIRRLEFADDVDWDTFNSKVSSITMCGVVVLPRGVPKLKALEKCSMVNKVEGKQ